MCHKFTKHSLTAVSESGETQCIAQMTDVWLS